MNLLIYGAENTDNLKMTSLYNKYIQNFFFTSLQEPKIVQWVSNLYEEYVCYSPYNL